jgi:hypothetical protein
MGDRQQPWTWKDDRTVIVLLGGEPKEFTLLPVDSRKVERFRRDLAFAHNVTLILLKAKKAFEAGTAEYSNAVRRLKKLQVEFGKALNEELEAGQAVAVFFAPGGIEKEFGFAVEFLTDFSVEAIERLMMPPANPKAPPVDPPKAADDAPPADETEEESSDEPELEKAEEPVTTE